MEPRLYEETVAGATRVGQAAARVVPYLGGRRSPAWDRIAARSAGVVVRGQTGARWLREQGLDRGLVDPATYEKAEDPDELMPMLPLASDPSAEAWLDRQRVAGVSELLAPGAWVPRGDSSAVVRHLDRVERLSVGSDVVAVLALDASWLTEGIETLLALLADARLPVAVALGDQNDPLARRGAVAGLMALAQSLGSRLRVLRCDVGAIGAVACGAHLGSIGTTATVRHVIPPGKPGGGKRGDDSPSAFVPEHLAFRRGSLLEQARDRGLRFYCLCDVCDGAPLDRFVDQSWSDEAAEHSWLAIQTVATAVLDAPVQSRLRAWAHDCARAVATIEEHGGRSRIGLGVPEALRQWANNA